MAILKDSLVDLERYRLQLEDNVARLRASLRYWQTWEAEYEGMKEEISDLGPKHAKEDMVERRPNSWLLIRLTCFLGESWPRLRR